jgi:cation:H+ antiporter
LGNLIGSNIFNIFLAIGVSAGITAMPVDGQAIASDFWWMLLVAAMILPMMMHQRLIHRWKGIILLATYVVYMTVVILGT